MNLSRKSSPQSVDQADTLPDTNETDVPKSNSSQRQGQDINAILSAIEKNSKPETKKQNVHRSRIMDAIWDKLDL